MIKVCSARSFIMGAFFAVLECERYGRVTVSFSALAKNTSFAPERGVLEFVGFFRVRELIAPDTSFE